MKNHTNDTTAARRMGPWARLPGKLLLGMLLCAQLAACQDRSEAAPAAPSKDAVSTVAAGQGGTAAAEPDHGPANDIGAKLNQYIDCFNAIDGTGHRTMARYASWVKDMNAGPTGQERIVYGLYSLDSARIAQCKSALEASARQSPALGKLDAAALSYANAIVALDQAVTSLYTYYDRENYKDDQFAKGKQLHAPLAQSARAFESASASFSAELDVENDKLLEAELSKVEKEEGRSFQYLHMATMNRAKALMNLIEADTFAADLAGGKLAEFEKIADETSEFAKKNPGRAPSAWFTVDTAVEDFRKAAKERVRRIRDKVPYNDGERMMLKPGSGWMVEGSQEKVSKAYNDLIGASNGLH